MQPNAKQSDCDPVLSRSAVHILIVGSTVYWLFMAIAAACCAAGLVCAVCATSEPVFQRLMSVVMLGLVPGAFVVVAAYAIRVIAAVLSIVYDPTARVLILLTRRLVGLRPGRSVGCAPTGLDPA
ncbi:MULTISPECIES: hypothetical protein [Rhodopseudomonas]|uniref:Uncharacterized protein n=1 Tax=Rhodopseudomonas palustris TaxID=1076 RepID=A0A0D7EPQ8_RHOPL|nr:MULTISPECIES: hypothetical protein [Rhodopseudomonas]KIZ41447.1 hypothetical protein OO17_15190 [Rhodopseudomonas palustris]MDF3810049.1 hypothetical protein [Rhodopseudomonas sp. BAL398]WOK18726.1 hypothetical protein RBJ75_04140 [Rhodopseudomonas sp. BAL398]